MATDQIEALGHIILDGIKDIQANCTQQGKTYPDVHTLVTQETEDIQNEFSTKAAPVLAAAWQVIATFSHPQPYLYGMTLWVRPYDSPLSIVR